MADLIQSDITSALKDVLLPYIRDNFPKEKILLDQMKRNAGADFINDEFIAPIYTSRHGGFAALADDNNSIINAGGRSMSRGTVSRKIMTESMDISDLAIRSTKSNQSAVENILVGQTQKMVTDFARHINRQLYSDGVGVVTMVRATGGSVGTGTIAVEQQNGDLDDGRSIDWYGTINGDISPVKYLATDMIIGVGTAGAADGTITSTTGTTVVCGAPTAIVTAANDSIYIQDGSGEGAGTSEIQGIRLALNSQTGTNTYAGLARNTTGWAPQFGSASEALTVKRIADRFVAAQEYASQTDKYVILMNQTLHNKYGDILTAMRRTVNSAELLGGWKGLEFAAGGGNVGVFLDYDVPDGEVVIINLDTWTLCQVSDVDWLEDPSGGGLLRRENTLLYQVVMVWYANALCLAPAANGRETRKTD